MLDQLNSKIFTIIRQLEYDNFLTKEKRAKLKAELSKILEQRKKYLESGRNPL